MWLIDTYTHTLEEFSADKIPNYAILSHTWEDQEVSFQEWQSQRDTNKHGYQKVIKACLQARSEGHQYIWVDTVCIDQSSSAEVSEAINSMFAWYKLSKVCYAYLVDVSATTSPATQSQAEAQFARSRWFTRGWTLQELLAPDNVVFFSSDWTSIGTKHSLQAQITTITGISGVCGERLNDNKNFKDSSVAQKMSWISRRKTTREEDKAYCMLGLFDIHMPLIYGEGSKAFIRLQEEVLKTSNDHTLFCWARDLSPESWMREDNWTSALAHSPTCFRNSGDFFEASENDKHIAPYLMTNFGLSITLQTLDTWCGLMAILDVGARNRNIVGIPLSGNSNIVRRGIFPPCPVNISSDALRDFRSQAKGLYIRHKPLSGLLREVEISANFGENRQSKMVQDAKGVIWWCFTT